MKGIKIKFDGSGKGAVMWNEASTGAQLLSQKAAAFIFSSVGSDPYTGKGTDMEKDLFATSTFNVVGMQHSVNFATVLALKNMRDPALPDDIRPRTIRGVIVGVNASGSAQVGLSIQNAAGQSGRALL